MAARPGPPEMSQPPAANKPIVPTEGRRARSRRGRRLHPGKRKVAKINVMGWSWGTSIAGFYTSEHNDKVNRLVLYAPQWIRKDRRRRRRRRAAARRLPAGLQGFGQGALAEGRARGQAGGSDSAGRVRGLGRRDLGDRSARPQSTIRRCCARPTASIEDSANTDAPARRSTIPARSPCRRCCCTPNGTPTCRAIWRRAISPS